MSRPRFMAALLVLVAVCGACTSGDGDTGPTTTTRVTAATTGPLPRPVTVRQEPDVELADPAFEALPGATADYGRLGGAVYQLEVPDEWNGRLVLWMHGFEDFGPEASVSAPDIRSYLIAHGYAWGASSFSSTAWIPGRGVEETAALWDHFTSTHERPERTYVIGLSMGGAGGHIAAERQPERFDGVLALCGAAGATPGLRDATNMFVAAAYAAGLTQADYDAATDVVALVDQRIRPALRDPAVRERFEQLLVDLTGGPRPFVPAGLWEEQDTNWERTKLALVAGVVPPRDEPYRLGPSSDVDSATFNREAIVPRTDVETLEAYTDGNELTGVLRVPLLTLHTTGDGQVPIEQARILRRLVDEADARELLVQRVYRDRGHCGFTAAEWVDAFEDLVAWVERDRRPRGIDVLTDDLADPSETFELTPRPGSRDAERVRGAGDRVVVRGNATLDGAPFDARFLGAVVVDDGLMTACQYDLSAVERGRFEVTVIGAAEAAGCGGPGAGIVVWTYPGEAQLYGLDAIPWPGDEAVAEVSVEFSTADETGAAPEVSSFQGDVLDAEGNYVRPGTRIEALVGDTVCGRSSTRRTGSFGGYVLMVVGPASIPACRDGATLEFRVDGEPAEQSARNARGRGRSAFDLTLPQTR